jgi:hypothetical protein
MFARAVARTAGLAFIVADIQTSGARALNERGIRTTSASGRLAPASFMNPSRASATAGH